VEVVLVLVVEVVPDVVVAVVAVVPEVSLIVLAGIAEVDVVELVSVAIVPLVVPVSVAVAIVDDVSVADALVSVLLAGVSLLQAKPNTHRARTVRRTRSFLLIFVFLSWLVIVSGGFFKASSTRFATSMPAGRQAPLENDNYDR